MSGKLVSPLSVLSDFPVNNRVERFDSDRFCEEKCGYENICNFFFQISYLEAVALFPAERILGKLPNFRCEFAHLLGYTSKRPKDILRIGNRFLDEKIRSVFVDVFEIFGEFGEGFRGNHSF